MSTCVSILLCCAFQMQPFHEHYYPSLSIMSQRLCVSTITIIILILQYVHLTLTNLTVKKKVVEINYFLIPRFTIGIYFTFLGVQSQLGYTKGMSHLKITHMTLL